MKTKKPKAFKISGLTSKEITNTIWLSKYDVCLMLKCDGREIDRMVKSGKMPIPYEDKYGRLIWRENQIKEIANELR